MFDIATVGHFSIDFIVLPGETRPKRRLGGPPVYTSLSAKMLGATVSVVSKVGWDFPKRYLEWLRRRGIDLLGLKVDHHSQSTSFQIKYYLSGERDMILRSKGPPIYLEDLQGVEAKALHISPIANEVSIDSVRKMVGKDSLISLDPQGLLRHFDSCGRVTLHKLDDLSFLSSVGILKASENELKILLGVENALKALRKARDLGVKIAIATIGGRGAFISLNDKIFNIPAAKPRRIVDPTGAGDVFIGAFLAEYLRGEDALWCACVGSSAASFVIEEVGPKGFRGMREVHRRATQIYSRIVKVE